MGVEVWVVGVVGVQEVSSQLQREHTPHVVGGRAVGGPGSCGGEGGGLDINSR